LCSPEHAETLLAGAQGPIGTIRAVADPRYRCTACGNLTRFDVTTSRRSRAFHHYTVGGELTVEQETVLSEDVEDVVCRWCGSGAHVEQISADELATGDDG
jgi:hypothetical protein